MEYYKLPQSDLTVSKIALGCMRISDKSVEEVEELVKTALDLGYIILFVGFFKVFLFEVYKVPTESMTPAIKPNDFIIVKKFNNNYERNDIITFEFPLNEKISL